jgi:hypothetical protein
MYCPNCGAQNKKHQNYCRFCGLHLRDIEKLFLSRLVFGEDSRELKNLRIAKNLIDYIQFLLLALVVIGALMWIFAGSENGSETGRNMFKISAVSFFLTQGAREILGYFQRRGLKRIDRQRALINSERANFETRETGKLIEEKPFSPAQSAAGEETTELLFADNKTRGLD